MLQQPSALELDAVDKSFPGNETFSSMRLQEVGRDDDRATVGESAGLGNEATGFTTGTGAGFLTGPLPAGLAGFGAGLIGAGFGAGTGAGFTNVGFGFDTGTGFMAGNGFTI
jgi:hypothetical protein